MLNRACLTAAMLATVLGAPRIAWSQPWFQTGQPAELMVSGVGFNNSGGPLQFNHPNGLATDGTRLAVCDRFNNRVLVWNSPPSAWNVQPDLVLGQPDFTSNDPGSAKSAMNWPGNVSMGVGGVLAVADTENDRILIWENFPTSNGEPADVELDVGSYTIPGQMPLEWPWGVWTDGTRLAAVATMGHTILFWNALPVADDAPISYRINLPEFETPRNISTDGSTYFLVGDHNAHDGAEGPGTFCWNNFPTAENEPYDWFFDAWIKGTKLTSGEFVAGGLGNVLLWDSMPTGAGDSPDLTLVPSGYANGDGVDVVQAGGRIYVNNYNGNNVQVFSSVPTNSTSQPDFAVGSSTPSGNTLENIHYIQNPIVAIDGVRLIATSDFDRKLWVWDALPASSGVAPSRKISLMPSTLAPWDNAVHAGRLVLGGKQQVALWNAIPSAPQMPDLLLGPSVGGTTFDDIKGVALDARFLYVADRTGEIHVWQGIPASSSVVPWKTLSLGTGEPNHIHSDGTYLSVAIPSGPPSVRVYRVDDIENVTSPSPVATIAGIPTLGLNLPGDAITFDGALAVANTSGNGVYVWREPADWGDPAKAVVLGRDSIGQGGAAIGSDRLFMPASLAYDGENLWVGELKFSSRILKFAPVTGGTADAGRWDSYE